MVYSCQIIGCTLFLERKIFRIAITHTIGCGKINRNESLCKAYFHKIGRAARKSIIDLPDYNYRNVHVTFTGIMLNVARHAKSDVKVMTISVTIPSHMISNVSRMRGPQFP